MTTFSNANHPKDSRYLGHCTKCGRDYTGGKYDKFCFTCTNPHLVLEWQGTGKPYTAMDLIHQKGLKDVQS
ncbi:hypothetical protein CHUUTOTORO_01340 [Serratia phage vB_SmaM-ChuuTotoro]|nr:hypothetical protein CHUUTOTORO_01340 [Serratia phage vB_SmaM-ChuuTotoro]